MERNNLVLLDGGYPEGWFTSHKIAPLLISLKQKEINGLIIMENDRTDSKIKPLLLKSRNCKTHWKEHLELLDKNHIPKVATQYKPKG